MQMPGTNPGIAGEMTSAPVAARSFLFGRAGLGRAAAFEDRRRSADLFLLRLEAHVDLQADQEHAEADEHRADWALDEHCDVAARDQHGPPEVLLEARPEHKSEQDRSGMEAEPEEDIGEETDHRRLAHLEHVVV